MLVFSYSRDVYLQGETYFRKEAKQIAENAGARNISAVSSKLDFLVVGENAGSKRTKAAQLGTVQILSEDEFLKMVSEQWTVQFI